MTSIGFTLHLASDGEIGSGLGNEIVNDVVARSHTGNPVLRGSHLKGLLRATLEEMRGPRNWPDTLDELCFGRGGERGDDGSPGMAHLGDAHPPEHEERPLVREISRTRLTELGVAAGTSLRTAEAVAVGTRFHGSVSVEDEAPPAVDLAIRLLLLGLRAVGGTRSRGAGACWVDIKGESRSPGKLLRELDAVLAQGAKPRPAPELPPTRSVRKEGDAVVFLRLTFRASDPICCPDTPVVSNNVIRSGLGIPASAVQGALIARLAKDDPELAFATLQDKRTRAWPLLPCPEDTEPSLPVRVSLSHRMSKLPNEQGEHTFEDAALEPYDWRTVAAGAPLKGGDGVLFQRSGKVALWRAGDIPRIVTAHAVHHDPTGQRRRNLFTVEALAPTHFTGFMCVPPDAADRLQKVLASDGQIAFGKARTVRGGGTLTATVADIAADVAHWSPTVFVLQAPAPIPDDWKVRGNQAEELLGRLVRESGWGELKNVDRQEGQAELACQAACAVRFGWNRHGVGNAVGETRRLRARRVFLPGTVFVLAQPPSDLIGMLLRGLGVAREGDVDGRLQGYGAVLPHPGKANTRFRQDTSCPTFGSSQSGRWAHEWWMKAQDHGPTASQIAAVSQELDRSVEAALTYLRRQRDRPPRVWERWERVIAGVEQRIQESPEEARQALRTWQDLVIANRDEEG